MQKIKHSPTLDNTFGFPRFEQWDTTLKDPFEFCAPLYVQHYSRPVASVLAELDMDDKDHFEYAQAIVDDYVMLQRLLIPMGLYDPTYKLLDNCGVKISLEEFLDHDNPASQQIPIISIQDFGEISFSRKDLIEGIAAHEWEKTAVHKEHTKMHPNLQAYFNDMCQSELTKDVMDEWGKGIKAKDYLYEGEHLTRDKRLLYYCREIRRRLHEDPTLLAGIKKDEVQDF